MLRLLLLLLALSGLSDQLLAQGRRLDLPPPPPESTTEQDPEPAEETEEGAGAEEAEAALPPYWADAEGPYEELFLRFEQANDRSVEVRRQYLEELRGLGLGSHPAARKALRSPFGPTVMLAAEILEWVGGEEDAEALVEAASSCGDVQAVGFCLDSALRLANGKLPASAVRLIGHPKRQMRTVAESRLEQTPQESHLPKLLQFLNFGRDNDVRLRAARLLVRFGDHPEARQGLRDSLRGDSIEVALLAVRSLAGTGQPEQVDYLHSEFLAAKQSLEASYLLFGLLQLQDQRTELLLRPELESRLRALLGEEDPFVGGCAAAALGEMAFRTSLQEDAEVLNRALPQLLVRAVAGHDFYPQYSRFAPLAERSLRRITGESFPGQAASAWVDWLKQNHDGFTLVRGRIDLAAAEQDQLRVRWRDAEGDAFSLVGAASPRLHGDRVLGPVAMVDLVQLIQQSGLLEASMMPGTVGLPDSPLRFSIDISVGSRRKHVDFRGSAGSPWVDELALSLRGLHASTNWQALAGLDEEGRLFIDRHLSTFDGGEFQDETERAAALIRLSEGRLAKLEESVLRSWVAELNAMPSRQACWSPELSREFLHILPLYARDLDFSTAILELVMLDTSGETAQERLDLLASLQPPNQTQLMRMSLSRSSLEACALALEDERPAVRMAAVQALSHRSEEAAAGLLIQALDDTDLTVLEAGLRGLGHLQAGGSVEIIAAFTRAGQPMELRRAATEALGQLQQASALPTLRALSLDEDVGLQLLALASIAQIPGDAPDEVLTGLFQEFAGTPLESSYMRSLMARGGAAARSILRPFLLGEDLAMSRRAALFAGTIGDPLAGPILIDWLPQDPRHPELLAALSTSLCVDFRGLPDPAGTYLAWWVDNMDRSSSEWLRAAAADSGFELEEGFDDPTRVDPKQTVAELLRLVELGPTHLRASSGYFLTSITGVDAPVISMGTQRNELLRRTAVWHDWLDD